MPDTSQTPALDFEVEGAWRTAPDLLDSFEEDQLWSTRTIPFKELAGGMMLTSTHVKSGAFSGRWAEHSRYPTIHTTDVPEDWGKFRGVSFWAFSEIPTDELVTFAVESENAETPWKDYYHISFQVDWKGWKRTRFRFVDFEKLGSPAGWQSVKAVYFFTKIFNRQPNPYTVLHLDAMKLERKAFTTSPQIRKRQARQQFPIPVKSRAPDFDPAALNHSYPETVGGKAATAPIRYRSYFKTERALFGYYPRFQPGFVSFSPEGRAYLQYGSAIVQSVDSNGVWSYSDLRPMLAAYAQEELGFTELQINNMGHGNDPSIRFDRDGDAYMLLFVSDPTSNWRSRKGLLLHSRNGLRTWDIYLLPFYTAHFEKFVGHNHDRLKRPPVILLSRYISPTQIFITVPRKRADGTLEIPEQTRVADEAISLNPHSGEACQAITHGKKVFIAYGQLKILPGKTKEDGVPNYVTSFDIRTGKLSPPKLIGFGGINAEDGHNWPSIAVDSKGHFHVIINGHHNPFMYTSSLKPWRTDEWTEPISVAKGTSYAGLVIDKEDTLYSVTRCSHPGYYFRLSLHRKKAGQPWEPTKHLVLPFKPYYKVYYHKLVIDPATDRLFLAYWSQSASICVFRDEYQSYIHTWPDREQPFMSGKDGPILPTGTYRPKEGVKRKYHFYGPPPGELSILVSDDRGDTWHLATTKDFARE